MAKSRKPTPYVYTTDATELNRRFYQRYDENLLFNKAIAIACILDDVEKFKMFTSENQDIDPARINDKFFESLRAELHFTEMHQFEGFFAILIAMFKDLPHWIYLTAYHTTQIAEAIHQFIEGDISLLTDNKAQTDREFIAMAVYATYHPQEGPQKDKWNENLDNIAWIIRYMAKKYIASRDEYNSYKHGQRVMTGEAFMRVGIPDQADSSPAQYATLAHSRDAFNYLEFEEGVVQTIQDPITNLITTIFTPGKTDDSKENQAEQQLGKVIDEVNIKRVYEVTKFFNPKQSMHLLGVMNRLLVIVKNTRLAYFTDAGPVGPLVTLFDVSQDEVQALREKYFELHMPI